MATSKAEKHTIVVLGPERAGKSALIKRLLGKEFISDYRVTIGIDMPNGLVQSRKIFFRDVGATNADVGLAKQLDATQFYLVFDRSVKNGLQQLQTHITETLKLSETNLPRDKVTIIATHGDIIQKVPDSDISAFCQRYSDNYVLCSLSESQDEGINRLRREMLTIQLLSSKDKIPSDVHCSDVRSEMSTGEATQLITEAALHKHNEWTQANAGSFMAAVDSLPPDKLEKLKPQIITATSPSRNNKSQQRSDTGTWRRDSLTPTIPYSFALRMAGMAILLAGIIGLIYVALVLVNILSVMSMLSLVNQVLTTVAALFGASTSTGIVSSATAAGAIMVTGCGALIAGGKGLFRAAASQEEKARNLSTPLIEKV